MKPITGYILTMKANNDRRMRRDMIGHKEVPILIGG